MSICTGSGVRAASACDRRLQAAVAEHGRMDPARELAQLLERLRQLLAGALERRARLGLVAAAAGGEPQVERERDEPLLRAVVQVALEPAALGVARLDDPRARGGEILARLRVGERLAGQLGEVARSAARRPPGTARGRTLETITAPHTPAPSVTGAATALRRPSSRSSAATLPGMSS